MYAQDVAIYRERAKETVGRTKALKAQGEDATDELQRLRAYFAFAASYPLEDPALHVHPFEKNYLNPAFVSTNQIALTISFRKRAPLLTNQIAPFSFYN